ncbi:MAG: hypothetical protein F4X65_10465 [Chloroflexi bacterium]|nr:hypothetical protein [Chloroflexota bacterium]
MTSGNTWQRHDVLGRVLVILRGQRNPRDPDLRDGYPFLSSYQLAIILDDSHPEIRQELGLPVAGSAPGQQNRGSLAQYLAGQLSSLLANRHRDERINHIERAFLSGHHCKMSFKNNEEVFESTSYPLSMFRYWPQR